MLAALLFLATVTTTMVLIVLAIFGYSRRNNALGMAFWLLMVSATSFVTIQVLVGLIDDWAFNYAMVRLQTLPNGLIWLHIYVFSLVYTGRIERIQWRAMLLLYAIELANLAFIFAAPLPGWFLTDFHVTKIGQFTFVEAMYGWWFVIHSMYHAIYYCLAAVNLLLRLRSTTGVLRRQLLWVLKGMTWPILTVPVLVLVQNLNKQSYYVQQPFIFAYGIMAFLLARALFEADLLQLQPIAHPLVLRELRDAVIITDAHGRITELNPAARAIEGITDAAIGKPLAAVFPALTTAREGALLWSAVDNQAESARFECNIHEMTSSGSRLGTIYVLRDVTQREKLRAEALALTLEGERRKLLTTFIEHAMHEFRTPLSTIKISAYLAERVGDEDRAKHLAMIEQSADRTAQLVTMMAKMTELQSADPTFRPLFVRDLLRTIQQEWLAKNVILDMQAPDELPAWVIQGNLPLLQEAIGALIDNARRFGTPTGKIRLGVATAEGMVIVSVQDDGPGIQPDHLPRIFETFWRADTAHTTSGLGLGLPIALQVARLHGGDVRVESVVGQGSRFDLLVPLSATNGHARPDHV